MASGSRAMTSGPFSLKSVEDIFQFEQWKERAQTGCLGALLWFVGDEIVYSIPSYFWGLFIISWYFMKYYKDPYVLNNHGWFNEIRQGPSPVSGPTEVIWPSFVCWVTAWKRNIVPLNGWGSERKSLWEGDGGDGEKASSFDGSFVGIKHTEFQENFFLGDFSKKDPNGMISPNIEWVPTQFDIWWRASIRDW